MTASSSVAEVDVQVGAEAVEVEERVADHLAWPVEGHVAAAVDLAEGDAARRRARRRSARTCSRRPFCPSVYDVRVLDEQQPVPPRLASPLRFHSQACSRFCISHAAS